MTETAVQVLQAEMVGVREELRRLTRQVERIAAQRPTVGTYHPYIVRVEGVCSGWPVIHGTRITVQAIVEKIRMGQTPEEIVADYPERLTLAHVHDALSYYYENPEEIEAQITANQAALVEVTILHEKRTRAHSRA